MRVPDNLNLAAISSNLGSLASRHAVAARQASTGMRVTSPSTDPRAAAEISRVRHAYERAQSFRSNIAAARGDAEMAEGVLAEASSIFEHVQEIAVQGANGTLTANERGAMAIQISGLKVQLMALANTRGSNGYLFSGSATSTEPFDAGAIFVGNSDPHPVEIGENQVANVAADGAKAFTAAGGQDVFLVLDAVERALRANDQVAIIATLDSVKDAHRQVVRSRSDSGLLLDRLNVSESSLDQIDFALKTRQASLSEADAATALTKLVTVQSSIQQSIAVAQKILNIPRFDPRG